MKIRELMDAIRQRDLVLPEFQREYVWEREQAKQLFVSLFRDYPTGSLLFWKTDSPPELKNISIPREKVGTTLVILDGQQRLTTLYLLTQGEIPPYYTEEDIKTDPTTLYFNMETGEFQYYQVTRMRNEPTWVPVMDCFKGTKEVSPFQVAREKTAEGEVSFELAERYNDHLNRLRNILERDFPIQYVPVSARIDDAIDVFDRVNSLGTKLTDAELALAHITGKWPQARRVMKEKIQELSGRGFSFDLTFMVRAMTAVIRRRALYETIHATPADALQDGWGRLTRILDYLVTLLPGQAYVHSTEDINTTNVLVPMIAFLDRQGGKFRVERNMRSALHWMYAANTWARYTGQTDARLDHDVALTQTGDAPWKALLDAIIEQRGRIEVKPSDLEGRWIQHPLYKMTFVTAKAGGAVDWFNGSPLSSPQGPSYALHSHHIFPQSLLYRVAGYDQDNHLHKKIVNEIANRAFLTADTNFDISNKEPAEYLPEVEERFPGALAKQFVPMEPSLWKLDRFEDFLSKRRGLIAQAINERLRQVLEELELPTKPTLEEKIAMGEGPGVEWKASMRWDLERQTVNTELQKVIAKAVAGLMNFEGGSLLIGVADDGTIVGIEHDFKTLRKQNQDGFELALRDTIAKYLDAELAPFVRVEFEKRDSRTVAIVDVEPSPKPVFLSEKGQKEFYVRDGNRTRPLDVQETAEYIRLHWET